MEQDEKFSDDPLENIKIENEFLKLKLTAQYGDAFFMESNTDLSPEIENQFLKNIITFEEKHQTAEYVSVYEAIGKPDFKIATELSIDEITGALAAITAVMEKHGINLDFCNGPYPDEIIYKFITEELFEKEIEKESPFGNGWNFIYEEFYPNDKADIEKNTHQFLGQWFTNSFSEYSTELDFQFITAAGDQLNKEEVLQKMQLFFDAFTCFKDDGYNIDDIKFELHENGLCLGHAEGMLKYDAVMENGEIIHYQGPYKLYMRRDDNYWSIFYFVMPGFIW